ncbi:type IV secretion system protein VirB9 [Variovorax sp. YR216]|nr:type IV secretion system protein VirB9 [Variovorax sp. YR216]
MKNQTPKNPLAVTPLFASFAAVLALGAGLCSCAAPAHAAKFPNPLVTDNRVRQVAYDPNQVYEIVGTYGYQTSIEFAADEKVEVVTLGDSIAWQTVPYRNRLFLKPVEPNAETNLTVITDRRTYYFKLMSGKGRATQTFLVRFVYPQALQRSAGSMQRDTFSGMNGPGTSGNAPAIDMARMNIDYSTSGETGAIQLKRAFDDGQFTYFQFDKGAEIPAVYTVGPDGTESIVNTRREGGYLVVERTAGRFTLRNGEAYLCVQSNALAGHRSSIIFGRPGGRTSRGGE